MREVPFSPDYEPVFEADRESRRAPAPPDSELQALMEAAPGDEPRPAPDPGLRDRLADAIDTLPEKERWVFEAHHYRAMSFREMERVLGSSKSSIHRAYNRAVERLRQELS